MNEPARPQSRTGLTIGIAALFGGLWLLLNALDVAVPPFKRLWPVLFLLAAASALFDFLALSRHPRAAGWAVAWTGFGVLGLALTMGYTDLFKILDWLPSFPTIVGLALVTTWAAARGRGGNNLAAGLVLLVLGLLGFGARFDWLQRLLPSAQVIWAILFLVGGGILVWRTLGQRRG